MCRELRMEGERGQGGREEPGGPSLCETGRHGGQQRRSPHPPSVE